VHGLESTWGDQIQFVYLDIDDPRTNVFKSQLGYLVQPHLFLLDGNGSLLQQWLGFVEASELESAFREVAS
jgi:hypothetical protein